MHLGENGGGGGEAHAGCSSIWMALLWTVVTNPSSKVDDDIRVVAWFFEIAAFLSFFLYLFFLLLQAAEQSVEQEAKWGETR